MPKGEDTSNHPNRGVSRGAFMMTGADMEYLRNRTQPKKKEMPACVNCGAGVGEDCAPHCPVND